MTPISERAITALGWAASIMALVMFLSYGDQIALNLAGQKGSKILPLATMLNCGLWAAYGFLKPKRDWPIMVANVPGVVLAAVTLVTAF